MGFARSDITIGLFELNELGFAMARLQETIERHLLQLAHQQDYAEATMPLTRETLSEIDAQMEIDAEQLRLKGSDLPKLRRSWEEASRLRAPVTKRLAALREEGFGKDPTESLLLDVPRDWLEDAEEIAGLAHHAGNLVVLNREPGENTQPDFDELRDTRKQERELNALLADLRAPRPLDFRELDALFTVIDKYGNAIPDCFKDDPPAQAESGAYAILLHNTMEPVLTELRRIPALPPDILQEKLRPVLKAIDCIAVELLAFLGNQPASPCQAQAEEHFKTLIAFRRQCGRKLEGLLPMPAQAPLR